MTPESPTAVRSAPTAAPSREDPLVARLSEVVGGPAGGRRAPYRGVLQAATVLVLLAVGVLAAGLVTKAHCRAEGWSSPDQFWHACYSDNPALYAQAGLGPSSTTALPDALELLGQPPLAGTAMWLVGRLVGADDPAREALQFFDLSAVVLAAALALGVALLARAAPGRPWDAAHLALSPVVLLAGLVSYDLLAVALVAAAALAWSRRHPAAAGVLLGLAVATRPVYALVGVALVALALRTSRWVPVLTACGLALVTWLGLRVVLLPGWDGGLGEAWGRWRDQEASYGSLWLVPDLLARSRPRAAGVWPVEALPTATVTALALLGVVVVVLVTVLLALAAPVRPRLAHVALFAVAGVLLVSKSVPPQAALLLLPLVALAGLRWRDHLVWAGAETVYFVAVWLYIAGTQDPDRGLTAALYALVLLARSAALVRLMVCAARAMRAPEADPVRGAPDDEEPGEDPHAGPLAGLPDALVVRTS